MDSRAAEIVHEVSGLLFECAEEETENWMEAIARFHFFEGGNQTNFAYTSSDGELKFFFPQTLEARREMRVKLEMLREMTMDSGKQWIVCLIRVSKDGKFEVDFEYSDEEKWNPERFAELESL